MLSSRSYGGKEDKTQQSILSYRYNSPQKMTITKVLEQNRTIARIMADNLFEDRRKAFLRMYQPRNGSSVGRVSRRKTKPVKEQQPRILIRTFLFQYSNFECRVAEVKGWKPCSREGGVMHSFQGSIYVFGGICNMPFYEYAVFRDGEWSKFSRRTDTITEAKAVDFASCHYKNNFYFFGGNGIEKRLGPFREALNLNLVYDAREDDFSVLKRVYVQPRIKHTVSMIEGQFLILVGGLNSNMEFFDSVDYYDLKRNVWSSFDSSVSIRLASHTAITLKADKVKYYARRYKESILLFGGRTNFEAQCTNRLQLLTLKNDFSPELLDVPAMGTPPAPRLDHGAVYSDDMNCVLVVGGRNLEGRVFSDLFVLNLYNYEWSQARLSGTGFRPRYSHSCVFHQHSLYIFGGLNYEQLIHAEMYILSLKSK